MNFKTTLKVALVHDQLSEFGGAERVLLVLHQMFPRAPIYAAFVRSGSPAADRFRGADLRPSWARKIPWFTTKLHSPLRFLAPLIWESFDFTGYDLVISSCSWYITKGILTRPETVHIAYIHTPPRYLYGYPTSIDWQKYWPLRVYARVVNHFLREYDFVAAQRPDVLIANSENTRRRIRKFYRRDAKVVYPPVELTKGSDLPKRSDPFGKYFLVVSRVVGGKGLKLAVQACTQLELPLKVVGLPAGWSSEFKQIQEIAGLPRRLARRLRPAIGRLRRADGRSPRLAEAFGEAQVGEGGSPGGGGSKIEFLGYVSDEELAGLYAGAKAFLATAQDEDFGMTVVEAQLAGAPVIAYRGGGYLETVIEGKTGVFFDDYSVRGLKKSLNSFNIQHSTFNINTIRRHAQKFSKDRFVKQMNDVIRNSTKLLNCGRSIASK